MRKHIADIEKIEEDLRGDNLDVHTAAEIAATILGVRRTVEEIRAACGIR